MTSIYEKRLERKLKDEEWKKSMKSRNAVKAIGKADISMITERLKETKDKAPSSIKSKPYSHVGSLSSKWQQRTDKYLENQKLNPFSGHFGGSEQRVWDKKNEGYAIPVGKTMERWKKGNAYITKEIGLMIEVIQAMGERDENGNIYVYFGRLFERYAKISTNLVGYLIRARKRGWLDFEGEMLWQRRDDDVIITLSDEYSLKDKD